MHKALMIDSEALKHAPGLRDKLNAFLGPNTIGFLERVYGEGLAKYAQRLMEIGFAQRQRVLDAGCGVGQWSLSLAGMCRSVYGVDLSAERVQASRLISQIFDIRNTFFATSHLETLPFQNGYFDGAVCYSVLYLTDYRRAIPEIARTLRPQGLFYLSTNGIGRYLFDILKRPHPASDFDPRRYGWLTLKNTLMGRRSGLSISQGAAAMSRRVTIRVLETAGFEVIASGGEGMIGGSTQSFLPGHYLGLEGVFDILSRKR